MLCGSYGDDRFDFRPLAGRRQLRLELQYALQCRHDERQVKTPAGIARPVIAASSPVSSLLDWSLEQWGEYFDSVHAARHGKNGQLAFLRHAYGRLEDLGCGTGWEAEFPRDVWELRRLGIEGRKRLRFDGTRSPGCASWPSGSRWRLSIGRSPIQTYVDVQAVTRLARFLDSPPVSVTSLAGLDRVILERYLADLATDPWAPRSRSRDISSLSAFLDAVRRHQWDRSLPASAAFYPDDFPKPEKRLPRGLAEHVMAQVEQPSNLDRWHDPGSRLLTVILKRCGLRVGDATKIAFDCVIRDEDGAPYLRFDNRKMKREALVPIDEEVEQGITSQEQRILARWPAAARGCSPREDEPRRAQAAEHALLPRPAAGLAGTPRRPRRARPTGPPDAPPVAPHLRHPAQSERGTDLVAIQQMLGRWPVASTMRYVRPGTRTSARQLRPSPQAGDTSEPGAACGCAVTDPGQRRSGQ